MSDASCALPSLKCVVPDEIFVWLQAAGGDLEIDAESLRRMYLSIKFQH